MKTALPWIISLAALATLAVLAAGILQMLRKTQHPKQSNILMRWRVGLQLGAVVLLVLFLLFMGD